LRKMHPMMVRAPRGNRAIGWPHVTQGGAMWAFLMAGSSPWRRGTPLSAITSSPGWRV